MIPPPLYLSISTYRLALGAAPASTVLAQAKYKTLCTKQHTSLHRPPVSVDFFLCQHSSYSHKNLFVCFKTAMCLITLTNVGQYKTMDW